jgi:arginine dihydrolase
MTPKERARRRESPQPRTYLMCPPDYFTVEYAINPWMRPDEPVDLPLAKQQWQELRATYLGLGHTVRVIPPVPGLPDMVFAANGGTVIGGKVLGAKFKHSERAPEGPAYMEWFRNSGYTTVIDPEHVNEGEGDIIYTGRAIIAGHGFRSDQALQATICDLFGLPVISVRLVDPRFYHLDTALMVLDADTVAYFPAAFDEASQAAIAAHFSELIEAKDADAEVLGLNGLSDGQNVVMPVQATGLAGQITAAGFTVVGVDMSEFMKAGGGPKCCTLVLR